MDLVYVLKMVEMMLVTCSYIDSISLFRPLHVFFKTILWSVTQISFLVFVSKIKPELKLYPQGTSYTDQHTIKRFLCQQI